MRVLYEYADCKIILEEKLNDQAIALLLSTLWGRKGPIFQHLDTAKKADHLDWALIFTIEKNGKTIGTCTVLEREMIRLGKRYTTWYGRYFAIDKQYQGGIFGNLLLKHMKIYLEQITDTPSIFYAYVEPVNPGSGKLLRHAGFKNIRPFETMVFSRFYPKKDKRVSKIKNEEVRIVFSLLEKQYENYIFVNFDNLLFQNNYFVLKINDQIVAGIQASIVNWKVERLPGFSGKMVVRLLPHIPFMSRLFNPTDFRFAAFEGIYCKKGYEKEVFSLMESACAELNLCIGMIWIDRESELFNRIHKAGSWGIMNLIKEDLPGAIVADFRNIPEAEQKMFYHAPAYISAFDLT